MKEEITIEEYRRLMGGKQKKPRAASVPRPQAEPRSENGWAQDYEKAGALGWQFSTDGFTCCAWRGAERLGPFPLGNYAGCGGYYRNAVVAALRAAALAGGVGEAQPKE